MLKKIIIGVVAIACFLGIGALGYKVVKSQGVTETFTINEHKEGNKKILIATQQREFKDAVMANIKDYYMGKPIAIDVIDVTQLEQVDKSQWDGVILFTTIESGKPPKTVTSFLDKQEDLSNVFMMLTADSGEWDANAHDIDVVTSASKNENITAVTDKLIAQIDTYIQ